MRSFSCALLILSFGVINGQSSYDAFNLSNTQLEGSARVNSMGGAFGALGGTLSNMYINPAGIGVFRKTEWEISMHGSSQLTETSLGGNHSKEYTNNVAVPSWGIVFSVPGKTGDAKGWVRHNWAIGMNRLANYKDNELVETTMNNSFLDLYTNYINSYGLTRTEALNSAHTDLSKLVEMGAITFQDSIASHILQGESINHKNEITHTGKAKELTLSYGGNFSDILYFGIAAGFPIYSYNFTETHTETGDVREYSSELDVSTKGQGINFKVGLIAKPVYFLRLGASIETPTTIILKDRYNILYQGDAFTEMDFNGYDGYFEYNLITPGRFTGSMAFVFNKVGLLSVDYELKDYGNMQYIAQAYGQEQFANENQEIARMFGRTNTIRIGGEYRLGDRRFRAGYIHSNSPMLLEDDNRFEKRERFSLGYGVRKNNLNFDFAYSYAHTWKKYNIITEGYAPTNVFGKYKHMLIFTLTHKLN